MLVVDDDPDILEALSEILEAEAYGVARARNGQEALERLDPLPHLILLDLMMPVMDGWEFARRLRQKDNAASKVAIIVLSADRNVSAKAREIGAVGYLAKPFELGDLLNLVRQTVGNSNLEGAPMAELTAKNILEQDIPQVLKNKPELVKEINAVIHFNITGDAGGTWTLDLTRPEGWVSTGAQGTPKMVITVSDQDFVKIRQKHLNAQMAAMQGKLKFKPMDMGLAMKLGKLLA